MVSLYCLRMPMYKDERENPRLRDTAYEIALVALATNSSFHKDLSSTVKSWPPVCYSALPVISANETQLILRP
ncbi:hypothetical protein Fmac_000780 [Flemingia macrophylla]|uniref:Uncharacterized protein n=1 Tax=Flemingia macrophylla TaxID=520843 RepID=A0ABD1NF81_9FABA